MTAEVVCRSIGVGSTMSAHRQAALLGLAPTSAPIDGVASRYRTEAVRAFTRTLHNLLSERVVGSGTIVFDMVTHFHRTHIGDARSGKWRSLDSE